MRPRAALLVLLAVVFAFAAPPAALGEWVDGSLPGGPGGSPQGLEPGSVAPAAPPVSVTTTVRAAPRRARVEILEVTRDELGSPVARALHSGAARWELAPGTYLVRALAPGAIGSFRFVDVRDAPVRVSLSLRRIRLNRRGARRATFVPGHVLRLALTDRAGVRYELRLPARALARRARVALVPLRHGGVSVRPLRLQPRGATLLAGGKVLRGYDPGTGLWRASRGRLRLASPAAPVIRVGAVGGAEAARYRALLHGSGFRPAATEPIPQLAVSGVVGYAFRECGVNSTRPVPEATVVFRDANRALVATASGDIRTDNQGSFAAKLVDFVPPVHAAVVLQGPRVTVQPRGGNGGHQDWEFVSNPTPYEIDLGEIVASSGRQPPLERITDTLAAAAAHIYEAAHDGFEFGSFVVPRGVVLPHVTVNAPFTQNLGSVLAGGKVGQSFSIPSRHEIWIGRGEPWERSAILHEGGHVVMYETADAKSPGGDHDARLAYPSSGALALDEGAATWFAAEVDRATRAGTGLQGQLPYSCQHWFDLAPAPALYQGGKVPEAENGRFAQWNETAIAGALWRMASGLGNTDYSQYGTVRILQAMHGYDRAGRKYPRSARELADALTKKLLGEARGVGGAAAAKARADERAVLDAFWRNRIAWGVAIRVEPRSKTQAYYPPGCDGAACFEADIIGARSKVGFHGGGYGCPFLEAPLPTHDGGAKDIEAGSDCRPVDGAPLGVLRAGVPPRNQEVHFLEDWNGSAGGTGLTFPFQADDAHFGADGSSTRITGTIVADPCRKFCAGGDKKPISFPVRVFVYFGLRQAPSGGRLSQKPEALMTLKAEGTVQTTPIGAEQPVFNDVVSFSADLHDCDLLGQDCGR